MLEFYVFTSSIKACNDDDDEEDRYVVKVHREFEKSIKEYIFWKKKGSCEQKQTCREFQM